MVLIMRLRTRYSECIWAPAPTLMPCMCAKRLSQGDKWTASVKALPKW